MRFEVFRGRKVLKSQSGSSIVGFVLVAPLVVTLFIAIGQIAMLVADKSVLNSAAVIGARTASAADASNADGRSAALDVLMSRGSGFTPDSVKISRVQIQGNRYVAVSVSRRVNIPFLDRGFLLVGRARALDEGAL